MASVPDYLVQVALTDRWSASPEWVDITQWVKSGRTKMGRLHLLQETEASLGTFELDNDTGLFWGFNTLTPFYNNLTLQDAGFDSGSIGSWTAVANCTLSAAALEGYDLTYALMLTASSSGDVEAATGFYPVTAGSYYTGMAAFEAATTGRNCTIAIEWYDGSTLLSTSTSSAVTDTHTGYTKATITAQAPGTATQCKVLARVAGCAASEIHYLDRAGFTLRYTDTTVASGSVSIDNTSWGPGQFGLAIDRTVQVLATWESVQYPVFYGFLQSIVPTVINEQASKATMKCTDALGVLSKEEINDSAYVSAVTDAGALAFWQCSDPPGNTTLADSIDGYTAILTGNYTLGAAGSLAYATTTALNLFGGYAQLPGGCMPANLGTDAWSFCAWIQTTVTTVQTIFSADIDGACTIALQPSGDGCSVAALGIFGGGIQGTKIVTDGNWHFVCVTYDPTGTLAKIFVDGKLDTSGSVSFAVADSYYYLGAFQTAGNFNGSIDEVATFDTTLSAATVTLLYDVGSAGFITQYSGQMIEALLQVAGVPSAFYDCEQGVSMVQSPISPQTTSAGQPPAAITYKILELIQQVNDTEQGFIHQDASGIIRFWSRYFATSQSQCQTAQAVFGNNSTDLSYVADGFSPANDDVDTWNDVPVQISTTSSVDGTSTTTAQSPVFETTNQDSIDHYGRRTLDGYTNVLFVNPIDALGLSQWLCAIYAWPYTRIRGIKLSSTVNFGSTLAKQLGLNLLNAIEVNYQPHANATPLSQLTQIEQITHSFDPNQWDTTFATDPTLTQNQWFIVDDPVLGVVDQPNILVAF
jgi:hypothetical protein